MIEMALLIIILTLLACKTAPVRQRTKTKNKRMHSTEVKHQKALINCMAKQIKMGVKDYPTSDRQKILKTT